MASPGSDDDDDNAAAAAVVCCMCGDHGLPRELFRCSLCRLRMQHRYCSDLYPRVAGPYRRCNWCLREEGSGASDTPVKETATTAGAKRRLNDSRGEDRYNKARTPCGGCARSEFSAEPGKPVKKPKKGRERTVRRPVVTAAAKERREEVPADAGRKARFRVKVRRYKLLAEVIC